MKTTIEKLAEEMGIDLDEMLKEHPDLDSGAIDKAVNSRKELSTTDQSAISQVVSTESIEDSTKGALGYLFSSILVEQQELRKDINKLINLYGDSNV